MFIETLSRREIGTPVQRSSGMRDRRVGQRITPNKCFGVSDGWGARCTVLIDSESEPGEGSSRDFLCDCETTNFAKVRFQLQQWPGSSSLVTWRQRGYILTCHHNPHSEDHTHLARTFFVSLLWGEIFIYIKYRQSNPGVMGRFLMLLAVLV